MSLKNIGAPFYHSCLKTPVNPKNNFPCPKHERNSWIKKSDNMKSPIFQSTLDNDKMNKEKMDKNPLDSIVDFYGNIPDYKDMVHLSNREFYTQLDNLKEKQRIFFQNLGQRIENDEKYLKKNCKKVKHYQISQDILKDRYNSANSSKISIKNNTNNPNISMNKNKKSRILHFSDSTSQSSNDSRSKRKSKNKQEFKKNYLPSDYEIDKHGKEIVERPLSSKTTVLSSCPSYSQLDNLLDQMNYEDFISSTESEFESFINPTNKGKSVAWKDPKITIPKPFKMTIREEEDKEINQLENEFLENENKMKLKTKKKKCFKAKPVPYHAKIPLFNKIMEEQERRNQQVRNASKAELEAQMQPFSFVDRDEAQRRAILYRARSTPDLRENLRKNGFRARPIPKYLFTGLAYQRMREQEYLRSLDKKIRAEELLRSSSLPPSMAAREEINKLLAPPSNEEIQSNKDLNSDLSTAIIKRQSRTRQRRNHKIHTMPNFARSHAKLENELQSRKNSNISTSTEPFKLHMSIRKCRTTSTSPRDSDRSPYTQKLTSRSIPRRPCTSLGLPLNRNNLAAVLRIQSAKERLEKEAMERHEEAQKRTDARIRALMERQRRAAAWASLDTLCPPVNRDVQRRVIMRREEERLRRDEYLYDMELMYSRVQEIPTLFERQSKLQKIDENKRKDKIHIYKYNYENEIFETDKLSNSLEDLERKSSYYVKLNGNSSIIKNDKTTDDVDNYIKENNIDIDHASQINFKLKASCNKLKIEKSEKKKILNGSKNSSGKCTRSGSLENLQSDKHNSEVEHNSNKTSSTSGTNSKSKNSERKSATYHLSDKSSSIEEELKINSNHSNTKDESDQNNKTISKHSSEKYNGNKNKKVDETISKHINDKNDEDDVIFEKKENKEQNEDNTGSELDDFYED